MKREGFNNPKIMHFAAELGIDACFARGVMESIWHVTALHYPNGAIGRASNKGLASSIGYSGDADRLVEVLIAMRLIDVIPEEDGRLYVHGWHEHAEDSVHMRLARNGQRFGDGTPPKLNRLSGPEKEKAELLLASQDGFVRTESTHMRTTSHKPAQHRTESAAVRTALSPKPKPCTPPTPPPASTVTMTNGSGRPRDDGTDLPNWVQAERQEPEPDRMPDGTKRLSADQASALNALAVKHTTGGMDIKPNVLAQYRALFEQGLTVEALTEVVTEVAARAPERIGSMVFFTEALKKRLAADREPVYSGGILIKGGHLKRELTSAEQEEASVWRMMRMGGLDAPEGYEYLDARLAELRQKKREGAEFPKPA